MALATPTIGEIADNIVADIESKIGQDVPLLPKAFFRVIALAIAGVWIILYKFGSWQFSQIFPQLAAQVFLKLLGENKRVTQTPAVSWKGDIEITVTGGGEMQAGTQLVNNQTSVIYLTQAGLTLVPPDAIVEVLAVTAGEIGDLQVGATLDFVNPLPNVERQVVVDSITEQGSDEEDLEVYRQRVIDAYQKQPQGGALADYEQWGNETPDVINTYPYSGVEPADVDNYIEVDNQTDGIPTAGQKTLALQYMTYDPVTGRADRAPVNAVVTVDGITRTGFDVEITGLSPDTPETRAAIQAAVVAYFLSREPYILGLSIIRVDKITEVGATATAENAASLLGATFTTLDLEEGGSPVTSYTLGTGEKSKLDGDIVWS